MCPRCEDHHARPRDWRIVSRFAELADAPLTVGPGAAYAIFDGLFQQGLLRQLAGQEAAAEELRARVEVLLDGLLVRGS
ncbi:hypothetical protein ACQEVF_52465 [Nonomuraea polychroma]|uniref:hypothetical protein n=1 Tax=Nonomuraea polychroma TaxID=46176 RepID=UPI003D91A878